MKTLYDLLGARRDDDAEALRAAFRKAAKANHPDLHAGDPYAARRFRRIAEAYEILRDAEQRATYDQWLQFEHERLRWTLKSTVSHAMHSIVFDAVTAVGLAIVLVGGYMTYAHFSRTPTKELAGAPTRGAARVAAGQPAAPTNVSKPDKLGDSGYAVGRAPANGGPLPQAAALNSDVARVVTVFSVTADRAGPNSVAERPDQSARIEMPDQNSAQLVKVLSSSLEGGSVGKSSASDFARSDDTSDMNRRATRDINANDVKVSDTKPPETKLPETKLPETKLPDTKLPETKMPETKMPETKMPETKMPGRARRAAKLQATSRTDLEQDPVENRNTCSDPQSCSRDLPPSRDPAPSRDPPLLFGVGF